MKKPHMHSFYHKLQCQAVSLKCVAVCGWKLPKKQLLNCQFNVKFLFTEAVSNPLDNIIWQSLYTLNNSLWIVFAKLLYAKFSDVNIFLCKLPSPYKHCQEAVADKTTKLQADLCLYHPDKYYYSSVTDLNETAVATGNSELGLTLPVLQSYPSFSAVWGSKDQSGASQLCNTTVVKPWEWYTN